MTTNTKLPTGFLETHSQLQARLLQFNEAYKLMEQYRKELIDGVFRVCPLADQYSLLLTFSVDERKVEFKIFHGHSFEEIKDISLLPVDVAMAYVSYRRDYEVHGKLPESNSVLTDRFLKVMQTKYSESLHG